VAILLANILQPDQKKAVAAASGLFSTRRSPGAIANTLYYESDHWQKGDGWIGAKPLVTNSYNQTMLQIKDAFVSENVIAEVVDRHVGGILGREPLWGFVPQATVSQSAQTRRKRFAKLFSFIFPSSQNVSAAHLDRFAQEADEALTVWWDQGQPRKRLKEAIAKCLNEERVLLRLLVPRGLYNDKKEIPVQPSLADALKLLHIQVVTSDKGGVFIDSTTQKPFGLYVYKVEQSQCVELSYVDDVGETVHQILSDDPKLVAQPVAYDMQGRLWMHEVQRKPLITEQIRSNQKSLNLALTMMMRNVNLAGNLERVIMNAERPKRKIRVVDNSAQGYHEETVDSDWLTGPGVSNLLSGLLVRDDDGKIIGRANPNISYKDPVAIDTFVGTRAEYRECILGQAQQIHVMISGDSTVSGRSREQARAEYRGSLLDTKEPLDDAGRWILEGGLRIAAQFCNRVGDFAGLRCDFDSRIEDGPISPEERSANREDVAAKLLSRESAMSRNGTEDTDSEKLKIAEDQADAPEPVVPPSPKPANGDSQLLQ
jgi:hypothetical protein